MRYSLAILVVLLLACSSSGPLVTDGKKPEPPAPKPQPSNQPVAPSPNPEQSPPVGIQPDDQSGDTGEVDQAGTNGASDQSTAADESVQPANALESIEKVSFAADPGTILLNPERGFHDWIDLLNREEDLAAVRANGYTLAFARVNLQAFRNEAISPAWLNELTAALNRVRAAGIKLILRFVYDDTGSGHDTTRQMILLHLSQLRPILRANADVIAVMQGGFIGAWGEWHSSTNGLDTTRDRLSIIRAELAALSPDRSIQLRRPFFKQEAVGPQPLDFAGAWENTAAARIGHHNDCFLASDTDEGTYVKPVELDKTYLAADSKFVPVGGETCKVNPPRSNCASALRELARFHYQFINDLFDPEVLNAWRTEGCYQEISLRLGYRFELGGWTVQKKVIAGEKLPLTLSLINRGFASPFNWRPIILVLEGNGRKVEFPLQADMRQWSPGVEVSLDASVILPADLEAGTYTIYLWLPDAYASIRNDPRYAIRLAPAELWDPIRGSNRLTDIEVTAR